MTSDLRYMSGFGGHFETEAVEGALPKGRNSPQRPAFGLYTEQLSGSSFTAPRHENRRSWLYRMRPTADHRPFVAYDGARGFAAPPSTAPLAPNRLRWTRPSFPREPTSSTGSSLCSTPARPRLSKAARSTSTAPAEAWTHA